MDNRRLIIFIALSIAVVATWQYLFPAPQIRRPLPAPAATTTPAGSTVPGTGGAPGTAPGGGSGEPVGQTAAGSAAAAGSPAGGGSGTAAAAKAAAVEAGPPIAGEREEQVVLSGPASRAVFSNRGAQLLSLLVAEPSVPSVELVRKRRQGPYPFGLVDRRLQPLALDQALFAVERSPDGRSATFRYRGPAGSAEKTFRFDERGLLAVEARASGTWDMVLGPGISNPTAAELDNRYGLRGAVVKAGDEVKELNPKGETEPQVFSGRGLAWAGLEDTYFATVAVPQGGTVARVLLQPVLVEPGPGGARFAPVPPKDAMSGEQKDLSREFLLVLEPAAGSVSLECYLGSKEYQRLRSLPFGLEETVRLGWLRPLVQPLLVGLHWIHDHIVPNYGWAIIIMTVLIKVLLLPLTHHSTMSMRKMQVLNPRMQAIRERYRPKLKDKQGRPNLEMQRKMNEEVMALYKAEGVNPAGGCLPLLVQMPILYAF